MFVIRGRITKESDPKYDPTQGDRVHKQVATEHEVVESLIRWTRLGRVVTGVMGRPEPVRPSWIYEPPEHQKLADAVLRRQGVA